MIKWEERYVIAPGMAEDVIVGRDIAPVLGKQPENVIDIWHYGLTEMINNAIDHSDGSEIFVQVARTATSTEIMLTDNGVGIFKKIQTAMKLLDERHAVLELAKGKLTTDPAHHTGEGVFFTSRMFDAFEIMSGGVLFSHEFGKPEDWILERSKSNQGTTVWMRLNNHTARTLNKVFNEFASGDEFSFTKTVVPVKLAQYGNDKLISRSQAKRVLARIELFKTVVFDFSEVPSIGQAFADEIFRVFSLQHPNITLVVGRANSAVKRMIARARTPEIRVPEGVE
ncbi:MAG TPA: DUF4325 domain-containing protein [Blastocatellia bacterium]|nr:DUF4325 domain-containing protein [Blastocatellia bacterium]